MKEISRVGLLAAGNLALASTGNFLSNLTAVLHIILTLGQVGVAAVTIGYILKKMRTVKRKTK